MWDIDKILSDRVMRAQSRRVDRWRLHVDLDDDGYGDVEIEGEEKDACGENSTFNPPSPGGSNKTSPSPALS